MAPLAPSIGTCASASAPKPKGHRRLQRRRGEPAGHVEGQIADAAERVLDVLPEDREEEHVAEQVSQLPCMNIAVSQLIAHGRGASHVLSTSQA